MNSPDKWVRRFSVDETSKHKNGFTIYKITSYLFPRESPEAVTIVSVWKRYSDIQKIHMNMKKLHSGLYLKGYIPEFKSCSYFRRFDPEVIEDRKVTTKQLLEFVAEHPPLFTSGDFVNFLQTGYPEPDGKIVGNIDTIRSSLHLPIEETTPLEYQSSEEDTYSTTESQSASIYDVGSISSFIKSTQNAMDNTPTTLKDDLDNKIEVSKIPKATIAARLSIDSISSLGSGSSCSLPYEEVMKMPVNFNKSQTLPDLICFDTKSKPSTSGVMHRNFQDYHDMGGDIFRNGSSTSSSLRMVDSFSEPISLNTSISSKASAPANDMPSELRISKFSSDSTCNISDGDKAVASNSSRHHKVCSQTEDTYVFEAGYLLNLGARCEDTGDYKKAFDCYKSGLEKMLIGVQNDTDENRRRIVKEKITKYLSYAETIYINHLSGLEDMILDKQSKVMLMESETPSNYRSAIPLNMLRRPYEDLCKYRVLGIISGRIMLVLFSDDQQCYAMKVVEKIPQNLTEFDNYFSHQNKDVKMPILPTTIPYMVQLKCFIETPNLLFIVLDYASGGKLLDYIANYVKSTPVTPAREVNLDNVFLEPQHGRRYSRSDSRIEDVVLKSHTKPRDEIDYAIDAMLDGTTKTELVVEDNRVKNQKSNNNNDIDMSVNDLVINSQRLLLNVSDVLNGKCDEANNSTFSDTGNTTVSCHMSVTDNVARKEIHVKCNMDVLAPSSVCKWGAEILTAIEYLHGSGVICRDLNPNNLLLAERGHLTLTYMVGYEDLDVTMALLSKDCAGQCASHSVYVAPEVYNAPYFILDDETEASKDLDRVCDFWSFGAIMYELITGVPLTTFHPEGFNSHTILQLPDELPLEVESLLTQLLIYDPKERLGSGPTGIEEIKQHPYFKNIDWKSIYDAWISPD